MITIAGAIITILLNILADPTPALFRSCYCYFLLLSIYDDRQLYSGSEILSCTVCQKKADRISCTCHTDLRLSCRINLFMG